MEELISVIVPVYNVEKYLNRCIDSIRNSKLIGVILYLNIVAGGTSGKEPACKCR